VNERKPLPVTSEPNRVLALSVRCIPRCRGFLPVRSVTVSSAPNFLSTNISILGPAEFARLVIKWMQV